MRCPAIPGAGRLSASCRSNVLARQPHLDSLLARRKATSAIANFASFSGTATSQPQSIDIAARANSNQGLQMRIMTLVVFMTALAGLAGVVEAQTLRFDDRGFSFKFGGDDRRGDVEGKRASCELYARIASIQSDSNIRYRCGFRGPQWTTDMAPHFRWCRWAPRSDLARDQLFRSQQLQDCFNRLGDFDDRR